MSKKIFISASTFAKQSNEPLTLLNKSGLEYYLNLSGKRLKADELIEKGKDCCGAIAGLEPFNQRVIDSMSNLKCISRLGVGLDSIDLNKAKERKIAIFNTPDVIAQPVAELTIAMAFDLLRRLSWQSFLLKSGRWEKKPGNLMLAKKAGILGLGRTGRRAAEMFKLLGADVCGSDIHPDNKWAKKNNVRIVSCSELLESSDILSIHLSLDKDNPFILGRQEIAGMKKGAIIINTSRGNFIDEEALYEYLKQGRLSGAALDVFSQEPYFGKLCRLDNVVLTPHIATLTEESRLEMEIQAAQNIINFFKE